MKTKQVLLVTLSLASSFFVLSPVFAEDENPKTEPYLILSKDKGGQERHSVVEVALLDPSLKLGRSLKLQPAIGGGLEGLDTQNPKFVGVFGVSTMFGSRERPRVLVGWSVQIQRTTSVRPCVGFALRF